MSQQQISPGESRQHPKVTALHLQRWAYIYIRQSTLKQVLHNQESQSIQYQLRQRAQQQFSIWKK